jgi:hypothetical protein
MTITRRRSGGLAARFQDSLEQRLLTYAAAAGASLVSVQAASAKVIYTPINLTIETGTVSLDLNHDGVVDFNLVERDHRDAFGAQRLLNVGGAGNSGAGVIGFSAFSLGCYGCLQASALPLGATIGPGARFFHGQDLAGEMARVSGFRLLLLAALSSCNTAKGRSQGPSFAPALPTVSSASDLP